MTNQQILEEHILTNSKLMESFYKLTNYRDNWKDDFRQEMFLLIMEMDNKLLNDLVDKGEQHLRYYLIRIFKNQYHSNNSPFHYKYRKDLNSQVEYDPITVERHYIENGAIDIPEIDRDVSYATLVSQSFDQVKHSLSWYERNLFELYLECGAEYGSYQQMSNQTDIPTQSIGTTIRSVKNYLSGHIKHNLKQ